MDSNTYQVRYWIPEDEDKFAILDVCGDRFVIVPTPLDIFLGSHLIKWAQNQSNSISPEHIKDKINAYYQQ